MKKRKIKRCQLHLYLTEDLADLLKTQAQKYGLRPVHYLKFILVRDLHAHAVNFNIRRPSEKERFKDEFE
jgi:hypothetical protein